MDGSAVYSFFSLTRMCGAGWPVSAGSDGYVRPQVASKANSLRHLTVSGAVVLFAVSTKSHELEKSE